MERLALKHLKEWKNTEGRKPLILHGARQVGKTWLLKAFGSTEYPQTAYINFETSTALRKVFEEDFNIERILNAVFIETGTRVNHGDTLLVLDEVQEAPGAVTSLKYFCENAPHIHVVAAGSLLGISMHNDTSFPVGKVEVLKLNPLSFQEFLLATGNSSLGDLLTQNDWPLLTAFRDKLINLLRTYYYTGGMPEAILSYIRDNDLNKVRKIQKDLLFTFENDFSKHAPYEIVPRIRMVWNAILSQLAKENRKFVYGALKKGGRAKAFEMAIEWLINAGLICKIHRISKPGLPLLAYQDLSYFKLYLLDVGLLSAMGNLDPRSLIEGNAVFTEFRGALTEQFVLQQLKARGTEEICYWTAGTSEAEVDLVIQHQGRVIPIEVKAVENLRSKSLRSFVSRYQPTRAIRTSLADYRDEGWLMNIPLFAVENFRF